VTVEELAPFLDYARMIGVPQVTVSGGDPLSHPDIMGILRLAHSTGFRVKLDTVGTAFLRDAPLTFYGEGVVRHVDPTQLIGMVEMIGLPLDGATPEIEHLWRRGETGGGRADVVSDTPAIVALLREFKVPVCVNTVLHHGNLVQLAELAAKVESIRPDLWQIFEFTPTGTMARLNRGLFDPNQADGYSFSDAIAMAKSAAPSVAVQGKPAVARSGHYFMVNDGGMAWVPRLGDDRPQIIGHVARDLVAVCGALDRFSRELERHESFDPPSTWTSRRRPNELIRARSRSVAVTRASAPSHRREAVVA
jgi:hypothetical protein